MENVNQLRTMWLEPPQSRLAHWREFRKSLDPDNIDSLCYSICKWWSFAPQQNLSIDPYDPVTWPSVWEMLHQGDYCKYSTAIGMAYTVFYVNQKIKNKVLRVHDLENHDIYMTTLIDNRILLNYNYGEVATWDSVKANLDIQDSWDCTSVVEMTKHRISI